jgi:mRNA export factor
MAGVFGLNSASSTTPSQGDLSRDVELKSPPTDSISQIRFCPTADFLAVSSWDQQVRIYQFDNSGNSEGKAAFSHEGPVLGVTWSPVSLYND